MNAHSASGWMDLSGEPTTIKDAFEKIIALDLPLPEARQRVLLEFERKYVEHILARHNGNTTRAAAASGVTRRYFQQIKKRSRML